MRQRNTHTHGVSADWNFLRLIFFQVIWMANRLECHTGCVLAAPPRWARGQRREVKTQYRHFSFGLGRSSFFSLPPEETDAALTLLLFSEFGFFGSFFEPRGCTNQSKTIPNQKNNERHDSFFHHFGPQRPYRLYFQWGKSQGNEKKELKHTPIWLTVLFSFPPFAHSCYIISQMTATYPNVQFELQIQYCERGDSASDFWLQCWSYLVPCRSRELVQSQVLISHSTIATQTQL